MTRNKTFWLLFFATFLLAWALRLPHLSQRPMHTDEAIHALKCGELLEKGTYRYDPHEYHGPTLNYFSLIPIWLFHIHNQIDLTETILRWVPVFFGAMTVLLLLLFVKNAGWPVVILSGLFTAVAPSLVFYSRYYIQESLLVFFTLGALASLFSYWRSPRIGWALLFGLFSGFMHATKETCIIAWIAMLGSLILVALLHKSIAPDVAKMRFVHVIVALVSGIMVSITFFSSFFTHPAGIFDSFTSYITYAGRAAQNQFHIHPWYYYLQLLTFINSNHGPIWSNWIVILLAFICIVLTIFNKDKKCVDAALVRYLLYYTLIMVFIYSAIPYKTPWSMLSFFHGLIMLSAIGAMMLKDMLRNTWLKASGMVLMAIGICHLLWQTILANGPFDADPRNPYVYGHTSRDIFTIVDTIHKAVLASSDGSQLYIEVICPGDDYWPLPWYLRSCTRVGWWNRVDDQVPAAPLIICAPAVESDLAHKLYDLPPPGEKNLYMPLFEKYVELRPGVEIRGYVVKDLWDRLPGL
jgi:uncharacterized protein (TIGR03663 family)